jgi:Tfp pilus assembly protein PilV
MWLPENENFRNSGGRTGWQDDGGQAALVNAVLVKSGERCNREDSPQGPWRLKIMPNFPADRGHRLMNRPVCSRARAAGNSCHPAAGFTLIEIMGALLILTVGMVSATRLATASMERLDYVEHKAEAVRLAGERVDSLGDVSYATLSPRTWADTILRGTDRWAMTHTVTQWSTRVRKLEVSARLVGDTVSSGSLSAYVSDPW